MSRPTATRDVVGFRLIFILFCTLVLLPAMLMSSFGVIAISNERGAEQQRLRDRASDDVRKLEAAFVSLLNETERAVRAAPPSTSGAMGLSDLRSRGLPVGPASWRAGPLGVAEEPFSLPERDNHGLNARVDQVADQLEPGGVAHIAIERVGMSGVVAIQRTGAGRIAYYIDEAQLEHALRQSVELDAGARFTLRLPEASADGEPVVGAVDQLMKEVRSLPGAPPGVGKPDDVTQRLRPPFDRYTLSVTPRPPGSGTVVVYIVLLLVFYVTLLTGVVITSRLIWQETKLSRLKTDFVSHVSHELRTPLTSIRMFIETLRMGRAQSDEEREECLEVLQTETERLSGMIERVLGYARLKSGRRNFSLLATDVSSVIDGAMEAFRAHTIGPAPSGVDVRVDIEENLPEVAVDPEALTEALLNLLGNAYKYTRADKRIRVFARASRRNRVVIGVEDNGPGLPKSEFGRIFDRFYQASSLLTHTSQGSGLGLAITRGIVEGMGGRIWVDSELGKGCTFNIELRAADA